MPAMRKLSAPKNIPYYLNRASEDQRRRLDMTMQHFGVASQQQLLGESLLRLGQYMEEAPVCLLPTDEPGKALFKMYKYYDSLK